MNRMKCDGPGNIPCRGCRQAGAPCVFDPKNRPKSIAAMPSRGPPYQYGTALTRGGFEPIPGSAGAPPFYPQGARPAPPVATRHPPPTDYGLRSIQEPLPPQSSSGILAVSASGMRGHSPSQSMSAIPQPLSAPYYTAPPAQPPATAPVMGSNPAYATRPPSPTVEQRLRSIESLVRPLGSLPNALNTFSSQLSTIQRTAEATYGSVVERLSTAGGEQSTQPRETRIEVPERVWQSYRNSAWPLTPWLVGLREAQGLPGFVISVLGNRPMVTLPDGSTKQDCEDAAAEVYREVGKLVASQVEWTREEVRALGVFA